MVKRLFIALALAAAAPAPASFVYVCDDYELDEADVVVYVTEDAGYATDTDEVWYFVDDPDYADFFVYFTYDADEAEVWIYFENLD